MKKHMNTFRFSSNYSCSFGFNLFLSPPKMMLTSLRGLSSSISASIYYIWAIWDYIRSLLVHILTLYVVLEHHHCLGVWYLSVFQASCCSENFCALLMHFSCLPILLNSNFRPTGPIDKWKTSDVVCVLREAAVPEPDITKFTENMITGAVLAGMRRFVFLFVYPGINCYRFRWIFVRCHLHYFSFHLTFCNHNKKALLMITFPPLIDSAKKFMFGCICLQSLQWRSWWRSWASPAASQRPRSATPSNHTSIPHMTVW